MRNYKKILSAVLALALTVSGISIPADVQAESKNLALTGTATASSYEAGTTNNGSKATDGNMESWWGTGQNAAAGEWLQVNLGSICAIDRIVINFERTDAEQNILGYHVEIDGTTVYTKAEKAAQVETITFDEAQTGQVVKLVIDDADGGTLNWVNAGVREFQIFGESTGESIPTDPEDATKVNLALGKAATADSTEDSNLVASNATDGDRESRASRWASAVNTNAHWIYVDLGKTETVKTVRILWETRKPTAYKIQTSNDASEWTNAKVFNDRPADKDDVIVLDEAVQARYVRLYIDSFTAADPDSNGTWGNVSIYEMEVYSGVFVKPVAPIDAITVETPEKGDAKLVVNLPESDDYTVTYNGTDYEQVIGEDLTIYEPVVDTTVNVSFKAVNKADESDYEFKEIAVTVPGTFTQEEGDNKAPAIIPELTEWKGYTGEFSVSENAKVVIASAELQAIAEEFAADYEDMTGKKMEIVTGTVDGTKDGEFFFALTEDTSLGLMDEGYQMEITEKITVEAETTTGAYWATRTILQALKAGDMTTIPQGITRDYPLYKVRGVILDVGRKTFTLDWLDQMVKQMAWFKLNDFHVHLNDNLIFLEYYTGQGLDPMQAYSGFRLESDIKAGDKVLLDSSENGTVSKKEFTYQADLTSKDVFYTKDEFRNFMADAAVRGVNIVPEFDSPAHSLAFTKVLPELRYSTTRRDNEELDLADQYEECYDFITNIFDEYMAADMEDPVFTEGGTVHIGCDEFFGNKEAFRRYCNDLADYVESTGRKARLWGSLTHAAGSTEVDGTGIEINLWNSGYANTAEMYELGFDLIDCNDGVYYIVPNAGYYYDYLPAGNMYNDAVNEIGGITIPAGDKQMVGAAYAVWNDMTDVYENGVSEYDVYDRLTDTMGLFAAKLWGKGDLTQKEAQKVSNFMGDAPNTNFGYDVEADKQGVVAHLPEEYLAELAADGVNTAKEELDGGVALKLNGGESYIDTGLETVGLGSELTVMLQRTGESTEDQILFESPYGSIKAVQGTTGKVGITRENHDYSFNYELPVGAWVELTFKNEQNVVSLYVNGELTDTLGDDEQCIVSVPSENKTSTTSLLATCMFPVGTIGSRTNAFEGYVADILITKEPEREYYDSRKITVEASSEETSSEDGAAANVLDDDEGTIWHSKYSGTAVTPHWIELKMNEVQKIDGFYYQPRTGGGVNGIVTSYVISISTDGENYTEVARGEWAESSAKKIAEFDAADAKYVRLDILDSVGGFASAAEIKLRIPMEGTEEPIIPPVEEQDEVVRISGKDRYATGYKAADALKEALGVDKFDAVVVATGKNFADALSGSYLAIVKDAPIILTNGKDDNIAELHAYIKENVNANGTVYILGGTAAVPAAVEMIAEEGYTVKRLAGASRYDTNLEILAEAGITGTELIVATGKEFADSLSASAAGRPILLVKPGAALSAEQKAIAETVKGGNIYVVGGTGAVAETTKTELETYATVERIAGSGRQETSKLVAEKFFAGAETVVVASAKNFPDGLCGGPLAAAMDAPLLLTTTGKTEIAEEYVQENNLTSGVVLGGTGALSDDSVVDVFGLESVEDIVLK